MLRACFPIPSAHNYCATHAFLLAYSPICTFVLALSLSFQVVRVNDFVLFHFVVCVTLIVWRAFSCNMTNMGVGSGWASVAFAGDQNIFSLSANASRHSFLSSTTCVHTEISICNNGIPVQDVFRSNCKRRIMYSPLSR